MERHADESSATGRHRAGIIYLSRPNGQQGTPRMMEYLGLKCAHKTDNISATTGKKKEEKNCQAAAK
jgi:hypothetical protein